MSDEDKRIVIIGGGLGFEYATYLAAIATCENIIIVNNPPIKKEPLIETMEILQIGDPEEIENMIKELKHGKKTKRGKKGKSLKNWQRNKFWQK